MKNLAFITALICSSLSFASDGKSQSDVKQYKFDSKTSRINWKGTKVTGEHVGHVKISEGAISLQNGVLKGGEIKINMSSMVTTDLSGEWKVKLEDHLKSSDFFDVANHKTASFKVVKVGKKSEGLFSVTGDLTIKGKTKQVTTDLKVKEKNKKISVEGELVFDRTDFNIRYGSGKFFESLGDKMIHDKVTLVLNLTAL